MSFFMPEKDCRSQVVSFVEYINSEFIAESPKNIYSPSQNLSSSLDFLIDGKLEELRSYVPITTLMLTLNSILGQNTLIEGPAGTGKTKLTGVIGAMLFQIPYDFFEIKSVVGSPGQTIEEIYATLDIPKLNKGEDAGILYLPFRMPFLFIDELNRYSELEQNRIRQGIATGVWSYTTHSWEVPNQVVASAINPECYGGTFILNENLLDNFSIVLEPAYYNPIVHERLVVGAEVKIKEMLGLREEVLKLIKFYHENKCDDDKIMSAISELEKTTQLAYHNRGVPSLNGECREKIRLEINSLNFTPEANLFRYAFLSEMIHNNKYGMLRAEDPESDDNHDAAYLPSKIKEALHGRFLRDWLITAKLIAWYFGKPAVDIEELKAAFIYTAPRRIKATQDFFQEVQNNSRKLPVNFELARQTIESSWKIYGDFKDVVNKRSNKSFDHIRDAISILQSEHANLRSLKSKIKKAARILRRTDHPLAPLMLEAVALDLYNKTRAA